MWYSAMGSLVRLALTILLKPLAANGQAAVTVLRIGFLFFADPAPAAHVRIGNSVRPGNAGRRGVKRR